MPPFPIDDVDLFSDLDKVIHISSDRCWRPQQRWSQSDEEVDALNGLRQKAQQRTRLDNDQG